MQQETNLTLPNKILYFPYMRVPDNEWFTRMLLYWDGVGTIATEEFELSPSKLGSHTRDLMKVGLVKLVIPGYEMNLQAFGDAFLHFVDNRQHDVPSVGALSTMNFPLHLEKIGILLGGQLVRRGLARYGERHWLHVEGETARYLVAFLVGAICRTKSNRYSPGTDDEGFVSALQEREQGQPSVREGIREIVLKDLLVAPKDGVSARELVRFKEKHQSDLIRFRHRVEESVLDASRIDDEQTRREKVALMTRNLVAERDEIAEKMRGAGWLRLGAGILCVSGGALLTGLDAQTALDALDADAAKWALSAVVAAGALVGIAPRRSPMAKPPLAYAALTERQFGQA
jgi:hypothetical protein